MATTPATTLKKEAPGKSSAGPFTHSIGIAGMKVIAAPDHIRTVLGSCIGVAMYDRTAKIGGMAHVILPDSTEGSGAPGKFADTAVDLLLEELLKAGAVKKRVAAKITGGAAMFGGESESGLGTRNEQAVLDRLRHHAIRLVSKAVGGTKGRKVILNPATGDVKVEIIGQKPQII